MSRARVASRKWEPVKWWKFPSKSTEGKVHTVSEWPDGTLSCDCPAWRFKKAGRERGCAHVREVNELSVTDFRRASLLLAAKAEKPEAPNRSRRPAVVFPALVTSGIRRMRLGEDEEGGNDAV